MTNATGQLKAALGDRYEIERHLGEGGMATVYLAEDLEHEREVAAKVLPSWPPCSAPSGEGLRGRSY